MSEEETILFRIRSLLILFQNAETVQTDIEIKNILIYIEALERNFRSI